MAKKLAEKEVDINILFIVDVLEYSRYNISIR